VLGVGGMGMVVSAEHTILEQRVALKFILDTTDRDSTERFLREARATARLESPNVCRIMDAGIADDGAPYIVMEMLHGMDLANHLIAYGPLEWSRAVDYVLQMLEGLAEAHRNGIVHRDLKPGNLFLSKRSDGRAIVKVLDFGISKLQKNRSDDEPPTTDDDRKSSSSDKGDDPGPPSSPTNLTATGVAMGSPPYMSPEQLRSAKEVDARCDLWAVGAILYELVTGARAFPGAMPRIADILEGRYVPLHELCPQAPAELERIIGRCLRVEPSERFASAEDLGEALSALVARRSPDLLKPEPELRRAEPANEQDQSQIATVVSPSLVPTRALPIAEAAAVGVPHVGSAPSAVGVAVRARAESSAGSQSQRARRRMTSVAVIALIAAGILFAAFRISMTTKRETGSAAMTMGVDSASSSSVVAIDVPSSAPSVVITPPEPSAIPTAPTAATTPTAATRAAGKPRSATPRPKASNTAAGIDLGRL
jgi:serine/threonine protein kinase